MNQVNHPLPGTISKKYVSTIPPGQKAQEANSCDPPPILLTVNQYNRCYKEWERDPNTHVSYQLQPESQCSLKRCDARLEATELIAVIKNS